MLLNALLQLQSAQHVSGTHMPIIRSSSRYLLLPHMLCNALVAGSRLFGVELQAMCPGWGKLCHNFPPPGRIACCSTPNSRPPATKALHTICGNNTSIVSSSWWWAYECPKHVEQIIIAIKHSVTSIWFSFVRLFKSYWSVPNRRFKCGNAASYNFFWHPSIHSIDINDCLRLLKAEVFYPLPSVETKTLALANSDITRVWRWHAAQLKCTKPVFLNLCETAAR
jgi:hypothetical protein